MVVWIATDTVMVKELKEMKVNQGDVDLGAADYVKVRESVMAVIKDNGDRDSPQAQPRKSDDDMQLNNLSPDAEEEWVQEEWDEYENQFDEMNGLKAFQKGKSEKGDRR